MMAVSAGTMPTEGLDPLVIKAMKERGISLPGKPRILTEGMVKEADLIVTMGCSVEETFAEPLVSLMEKKVVDWEIDDPKGKSLEDVKRIMAQIEERVLSLSKKNK